MILPSTGSVPPPTVITGPRPQPFHHLHIPYTYLVYDIEIVKAIPPKFDPPLPDIFYCDGWHDHQNMGISVIGAYDSVTERYRVFLDDNFDEFFDLMTKRDLLVGFNNVKFDNHVLKHHGEFPSDSLFYDILREIWLSLDLDPDSFNPRTHGGYSLDAIAKANRLPSKTGNGANAALAWQHGHYGAVIDYCLADVHLTTRLFQLICCSAQLTNSKPVPERLTLAHPRCQKLNKIKYLYEIHFAP